MTAYLTHDTEKSVVNTSAIDEVVYKPMTITWEKSLKRKQGR